MRYYTVDPIGTIDNLQVRERSRPQGLAANEVLVKVRAVSLNYKDLVLAWGMVPLNNNGAEYVPVSDGAGEILAVGDGISKFKAGDRVVGTFFPDWLDGPADLNKANALGREYEGMLAEYVVLKEQTLVKIPDYLSFEEAATFPCAAVTAWHALFEKGQVKSGQYVLTMGSGGVSLFALQFAKAMGATVIATTGNKQKEDMLKAAGADHVINYNDCPDWDQEVLNLTQGAGVDVIVEVGGPLTFQKSLNAVKFGGRISAVGVLTGIEGDFNPTNIIFKSVTINGVFVGSKRMLEDALSFAEKHDIHPVIDRETFTFDQVPAAYAKMQVQKHVGKLVITMNGEETAAEGAAA